MSNAEWLESMHGGHPDNAVPTSPGLGTVAQDGPAIKSIMDVQSE